MKSLRLSDAARLPPDKFSLAKLPSTSPDLFGRKKELKALDDTWQSPSDAEIATPWRQERHSSQQHT
jgi:hypothetical protein